MVDKLKVADAVLATLKAKLPSEVLTMNKVQIATQDGAVFLRNAASNRRVVIRCRDDGAFDVEDGIGGEIPDAPTVTGLDVQRMHEFVETWWDRNRPPV
jgi:hypothetical protein